MSERVQLAAISALTVLAAGLIWLIGYSFAQMVGKMTPNGEVPVTDGGLFTAGLLSFQQVVGAMRSIWESRERQALAEGLSNSVPTTTPNPPAGPVAETQP